MSEIKKGDRVRIQYEGTVTGTNVGPISGRPIVELTRDADDKHKAIYAEFVTVTEPAYEHNAFYRDAHGETFRYTTNNGDRPWHLVSRAITVRREFNYPVRPLTKLVPEAASPRPERIYA